MSRFTPQVECRWAKIRRPRTRTISVNHVALVNDPAELESALVCGIQPRTACEPRVADGAWRLPTSKHVAASDVVGRLDNAYEKQIVARQIFTQFFFTPQFQEEIERAEIRQEGAAGSADRDAPHEVRQAPGEEPQTS